MVSPMSKYVPFNEYSNDNLYYVNTCSTKIYETQVNKICQQFQLVHNQTDLIVVDNYLSSFTSYDYYYCVRNSFDKTCNTNIFTSMTTITLPKNFSVFNFKIVSENEILLVWMEPEYINGPLDYYVLYRNEAEVFRGQTLYFVDQNYEVIQPYKLFR
jgi:hypothetical protein